ASGRSHEQSRAAGRTDHRPSVLSRRVVGRAAAGGPMDGRAAAGGPMDGRAAAGGPMDGRAAAGGPMDGRAAAGGPMDGSCAAGGSGGFTGGGPAATTTASAAQQAGVVDITTVLGFRGARAAGTGMVLTPDGEVLTNAHVVAGATSVTVTVAATGRTYAASVV